MSVSVVRDDLLRFSGNPAGCHVIIVDDLVQTGGTLIECAKVSRSMYVCTNVVYSLEEVINGM